MKKRSRIAYTALACAMLLGTVVGCGEEGDVTSTPTPPTKVEASVWSTQASVKVTKNVKEDPYYAQKDAKVSIQMMKNETEGAQIVVTAGSKGISSYSMNTTDLSDGNGNTIAKEDISVYHQKYLEVVSEWNTLNTNYVAGDYVPDMLLPLETAAKYGENKIDAYKNQGITIEVKTTGDTVPGVYTGTFELVLDGVKQDVPVTVEVWDIQYEGRRNFQSSFLLYRNSLIAGEYEASEELVDRYIDFMLDYKMNTYVIQDSYTVDEFVEEAVRLWDNENYNSICIPKVMYSQYMADTGEANEIIQYILAIAKISTPEKPYMDALYIYPTYFDEADMFAEKWADFERVFGKNADGSKNEWDKTLERALSELKNTEEYQAFSDEFKAQMDKAILNIPAAFPNTTFREDWINTAHITFCPYLSLLGDDAMLQRYQDGANANSEGDLWTYTCVGPTYPNPTFHIDDYNLGTRVSGWMMKKFNVNGYLYWATNMYQAINTDPWRDIDVYETAERASYCGGDGFLLYPGAYYGSEYPFASVRLTAWRDAMDDYDMLCVYEKLLNEKAEAYGVEIDFNAYVDDLYDSLFAGTNYYTEDELILAAREELASRILALKSEDGIIVKQGRTAHTVYSSKATLEINGTSQTGTASGSGYAYVLQPSATQSQKITVKGDATHIFNVYGVGLIASFADDSGNATVTENSSVTYADGKASVEIVSVSKSEDGSIDGATRRFVPYIQFAKEGLVGASAICFTVENTGDTDVEFTLRLVCEGGKVITAGNGLVQVGGSRTFRIDLDRRTCTADVLASVQGVRVAFTNTTKDGAALMENRNFTMSDIWYEIK